MASNPAAERGIPYPNAFGFIRALQGSKKGDRVEGLYNLKKYLKNFGYIDHLSYSSSSAEADYFSDQLESAVKTYQTYSHLNPTGVLDADTVSQMMKPRCGMPDITGGVNVMQRRK
ncbi:PREDICTED: metalloendoproteinase 2-MMP-like [Ipomoea nil]|uniref:metalloendoproteinase 2-MMP-like n=1 Tax=Ipomoea nil TaxID=35883 RepID=UPI000901E698|nr:PREDICTED: metalloendoproteinase 2-MMP-like [Ipomoea nil]